MNKDDLRLSGGIHVITTEENMALVESEMMPSLDEISNLNLDFYSIREKKPTNREIREHRDKLLSIKTSL